MDPLTPEQLSAYFTRVHLSGFSRTITPNLRLLCKLHLAHVQHIPYENLSLHHDKARRQFPTVSLQTDSLFKNIIQSDRGGYCFEQNLLFAAALKACGFSIYLMSVRTLRATTPIIPNQLRPHIAIGVVLDGVHWHSDVGYGGKGLRLPIRNDLVQGTGVGMSASEVYKEVQDVWQAAQGSCSGYGHRLRMKCTSGEVLDNSMARVQMPGLFMQALDSRGQFQDQYVFQLQDASFAEFLMLNWYTSTCPLANHLNNIVVAKQTPEGPRTYDGKEFQVFKGTELTWSKHPESEDEVDLHLKQLFNLSFDTDHA